MTYSRVSVTLDQYLHDVKPFFIAPNEYWTIVGERKRRAQRHGFLCKSSRSRSVADVTSGLDVGNVVMRQVELDAARVGFGHHLVSVYRRHEIQNKRQIIFLQINVSFKRRFLPNCSFCMMLMYLSSSETSYFATASASDRDFAFCACSEGIHTKHK